MGPLKSATAATITVLATLVMSAIAYYSTALPLHRTAPGENPARVATPSPTPTSFPSVPPLLSPSPTPGRLFVWDVDMIDPGAAWALATDCIQQAPQCHYAVARSTDAGQAWSSPVQVGPEFASTDGDAPRSIRFLNSRDGFVYGHDSLFVTHDGGATWKTAGFPYKAVTSFALHGNAVWVASDPCAKGVSCVYELRSSLDGGRTWSPPHQLPPNFSPETMVAFDSGAVISALPPGQILLTVDQGTTWREITSPCPQTRWRGDATSADGVELWVLCQGYPDANGAVKDVVVFFSGDGGRSWSSRGPSNSLPVWLVSPRPHVAFIGNAEGVTFMTHDSGMTWSPLSGAVPALAFIRFLTADRGWALDLARVAWSTRDGGEFWNQAGALPSTLG